MALVRRRRRGPPAEHANSEATDVGATAAGVLAPRYDSVNNGANCVTANITTTKRCCIVVVTLIVWWEVAQGTQIQRGGVDRTVETTISAANFAFTGPMGHLQYSTEVLDAGTYTYALVNTSGVAKSVYGCAMKIVAVN